MVYECLQGRVSESVSFKHFGALGLMGQLTSQFCCSRQSGGGSGRLRTVIGSKDIGRTIHDTHDTVVLAGVAAPAALVTTVGLMVDVGCNLG